MSELIGARIRRIEDEPLLRGAARFVDDLKSPGVLAAAFVRSPHPHALIRGIDAEAARALPGIVAVLTLDDLAPVLKDRRMTRVSNSGTKLDQSWAFALADGEVSFVGEPVAIVVAGDRYVAEDAASLVVVDYDVLPAATDCRDAAQAAPVRRALGSNQVIAYRVGFGDADAAFSGAAHVLHEDLWIHRGAGHSIECRGILAEISDRGTNVWASTQKAHDLMHAFAEYVTLDESRLRVATPAVGGGFGPKLCVYPEDVAVVAAATLLGRSVRWTEDRREYFTNAVQERDQYWSIEIAAEADGRVRGIRGKLVHDLGAYALQDVNLPYNSATTLTGPYMVPVLSIDVSVMHTNKAPVSSVRGAGYPQASFAMERLLDRLAYELKIDRAELRRRNFIAPSSMPHQTRTGWTYDVGDYAAALAKCQALADWHGYEARHRASQAAGKRRGRGLVYYVDNTGIFNERMEIRFDPSGTLTILAGTLSHGQGHETSYAQMVSDWLGVPFERIRLAQADTDAVAIGRGTYASRSMMAGGSALRAAADEVIERGKRFAGHFMEADAADIEFAQGKFTIAGTDKSLPLAQVAQMSFIPVGLPSELGVGLQGAGAFTAGSPSFPNGCHICEVEIDPETGQVWLDRYAVVDDIGTVINPLLAQGQIHGGVAQGAGQALLEDVVHDPESGQLLSGTLMDYAVPHADTVPDIAVAFSPVPSKTNPLGAKGVGEGGTVAATPAVMNAIIDALAPLGVKDVPMPATSERVWRAIQEARQRALST